MRINLTDGFFLEKDIYQYILKRDKISYGTGKNVSDKGKLVVETLCYPHTIKHGVQLYLERLATEKTEDFSGDLEEYAKRIQNIIDNAVDEITRKVDKGK